MQVCAQTSFEEVIARYPNEVAVYLERSETMHIIVAGDSLQVYSDVFEETLSLKEDNPYVSKKIYGSHFDRVENVSAKTLVPEKKRFKEIEVTGIRKNADSDDGIFYDDSYNYSFDFPAVTVGGRTQLRYRMVNPDPRFISGYLLPSYLSQLKTTFSIRTSPGVELAYTVINDQKGTVKFEKSEKGGFVWYKWSMSDVPPLASEPAGPPVRYYAPHVVCYVKSFQGKRGKIPVLSGLDDLNRWYYEFVKDLPATGTAEMNAVVSELKAKSEDELSFVKNVYGWVQDNIKYIAFEQGMRGLIPHAGSYVFEKRYGDCKDMASIIINLLAMGGVKSYYTWIGTRDIPYKYSEYPTPFVDNHMIATYIAADGKYYHLDGTDSYLPFGLPSSMIQGKEAMIVWDESKYKVVTVPEIPMEVNEMKDAMWISIDKGSLTGRGSCSLTGFAKANAAYRLDRNNQQEIRDYMVRLIGKGSNKFILDDYGVAHVEAKDKPIMLDYKFSIQDYFQKVGDEVYINLNLSKDFFNSYINMDLRKTPVEVDYKYISDQVIELELPAHLKVEYLPASTRYDDKILSYEISYEARPNSIVYSRKIGVNYLMLKQEEFAAWNQSVRKLSEAYKETIILKEK
jgi:transglutaminase-like putative cysteine protease